MKTETAAPAAEIPGLVLRPYAGEADIPDDVRIQNAEWAADGTRGRMTADESWRGGATRTRSSTRPATSGSPSSTAGWWHSGSRTGSTRPTAFASTAAAVRSIRRSVAAGSAASCSPTGSPPRERWPRRHGRRPAASARHVGRPAQRRGRRAGGARRLRAGPLVLRHGALHRPASCPRSSRFRMGSRCGRCPPTRRGSCGRPTTRRSATTGAATTSRRRTSDAGWSRRTSTRRMFLVAWDGDEIAGGVLNAIYPRRTRRSASGAAGWTASSRVGRGAAAGWPHAHRPLAPPPARAGHDRGHPRRRRRQPDRGARPVRVGRLRGDRASTAWRRPLEEVPE